jgi:hypothetical protein
MPASVSGPPEDSTTENAEDASLGRLVTTAVADMQKLLQQELALAKAELREEASSAGKAAGMYGGAGFAGYMVLVLVSFAAVIGLGHLIGTGWSALIVAAVWAIAGAVMFVLGRNRMRTVSPKPERTIETLKEDAQWARHPTR